MKIRNIIALSICIVACSCIKEKMETIYSKQETQIDTYLSKNNTAKRSTTLEKTDPETGEIIKVDSTWTDTLRIVYNGGSARLVKEEGEGEALQKDGAVSFYYAGYTFTSSPSGLFTTNHQETAEKAKFTLTDSNFDIFEVDMRDADLLEGLYNGLIGVKSGEECEILFSGKHAFGNHIFGTIPANSALLFKIWVVGVSNE